MKAGEVKEAGGQYLVGNEVCPVGYKLTEVGIIPEDWDATTIGENTRWSSGGTPSRKRADYWEGAVPWISGSTLKTLEISTSDQFLTPEGVASGSNMAPVNATLLLVRGSALHKHIRTGLVVSPVSFNQDVKSLLPIGSVLPKFLTFYIKGMENDLLKLVSSAGNSAGVLDTELVKKFKFLRPGVKEQTAIANALSDVDALITSLEKLIAKKRAIKTAAMQQLLTGKKRLPPFDKTHTGYKQTELGEIPEDWEVKSYSQAFNFLTTASNSRSDLNENGDYQYIHYGDIHVKWDSTVDFSNENIPKIDSSKVKNASLLKDGDLIMADASEDYDGIGKSVEILGLGVSKAVSGLHTFLLRDVGIFVDGYRGYLHLIKSTKQSFDRLATGLKVYGISKGNLKDVLLPVPPKGEQILITEVLSDMSNEIDSLYERLNKTQQLKQGMMQELLTGRTRLV